MKRVVALLCLLAMVCSFCACGERKMVAAVGINAVKNARETASSSFAYKELENGVSITNYTGKDEIVVIPNLLDHKKVVSIETGAFSNKTMKGVRINDNMEIIGDHAFENCSSLTTLVCGRSLVTISRFAFNKCTALKEVELNNGLMSMEMLCFGDTNLSELTVPSSVEAMDLPFTANKEKTLTIISTVGSTAESFVNTYGEAFNLAFEPKIEN